MVSYPDGQKKNYAYLEGQTGVDAGSGPTTDLGQQTEAGGEEGGGDWSDAGNDSDFGDWSF